MLQRCATCVASVLLLVSMAASSGCSSPQPRELNATVVFADAMVEMNEAVRECYLATRRAEELQLRAKLAALVLERGPDAAPIEPRALNELVVTSDVSNRVFRMVAGLETYADLLRVLGGDVKPTDPTEATKATGKALKVSLDALEAFSPIDVSDFAEDVVQGSAKAASSVDAYIDSASVSADVPDVVEAMKPYIDAVAAYLIDQIGSPVAGKRDDGTIRPAHGLRSDVAQSRTRISEWTAAALTRLRADDALGDVELVTTAFRIFDEDVSRAVHADYAMAETQEALRRMVLAHDALSKPRDPASVQLALTFRYYAQRALRSFGKKLGDTRGQAMTGSSR